MWPAHREKTYSKKPIESSWVLGSCNLCNGFVITYFEGIENSTDEKKGLYFANMQCNLFVIPMQNKNIYI